MHTAKRFDSKDDAQAALADLRNGNISGAEIATSHGYWIITIHRKYILCEDGAIRAL